jgi:hypothetical protein
MTAVDRSGRIGLLVTGLLAAGHALPGCSQPTERSVPAPPVQARPEAPPPPVVFPEGVLPAAFVGSSQAGEMRIEHWTLWLKPDLYFLRVELEGPSGSSTEDLIGRWEPVADGPTVRLRAEGRAPLDFEVSHPDTLRFRDPAGRDFAPPPSRLVRNRSITWLEPRVNLTGYLSYRGDAGTFQDCGTGWSLPVLPEGDFEAARQTYRDMTYVPRSPEADSTLLASTAPARILVSLDARIVLRLGIRGAVAAECLRIDQFVRAIPGKACDGSSSLARAERSEHR